MSNKKTNPDLVRRDSWEGESEGEGGSGSDLRSPALAKKGPASMETRKQDQKEPGVGKWGERVTYWGGRSENA